MKLQVSRNDVVEFLRRTVMSFESWAERKKINLDFQSEIESASGFFDTDKLEKILNNLMSNALKFTPEGGAVSVSLRVPEGPKQLERASQGNVTRSFTVSDTGPGISGRTPSPHLRPLLPCRRDSHNRRNRDRSGADEGACGTSPWENRCAEHARKGIGVYGNLPD